ncbi:hypothetical protein [Vibrio sp. SCSIO 43137]|uniref:hypothetical protein n=1 Tax=Vibrio sp. SCSIO 43137 TaxID=3021011 RepID=UPI0023079B89|nr:hypothetical protein [Vibrio sp. SCSIO 43137]WCE30104.1 hypothetical protein PK654_02060 [Vibrio sp. SCSIO 43137]
MDKKQVKKITWSKSVESALTRNQFTPDIIKELRMYCTERNAEIFTVDTLTIITRPEGISATEWEVVWMASFGGGLKEHYKTFVKAAKRAGAKHIRFHISEENELGVLRLISDVKPYRVQEGVYRVDLAGVLNGS